MVISYFEGRNNDPLDKEEVWKISGTSELVVHTVGNDMAGLSQIAKHYGYRSEYAQGVTLEQLEYLLSKGIPVMVNIRPDPMKSATHALLIVGYDRNSRLFYLNDPSLVFNVMTFDAFEARWFAYLSSPLGMSRRSVFIVYPKDGWKVDDGVPAGRADFRISPGQGTSWRVSPDMG